MSKTNCFQVKSNVYTAGVVFDVTTRKCIEAAPIIKWAEGWDFDDFKKYCKRVGIEMVRVPEHAKFLVGIDSHKEITCHRY